MKKTYIIPQKEIKREWHLVDASGQILGRLATQIADLIRGKNKPYFSPHQDLGDYVVVINTDKIKVTGKKMKNKKYYHHSGYLGGLKTESLEEKMTKNSAALFKDAVWGMIPHNRLGRKVIKKLKVYPKNNYRYKSQKLEEYKIK